MPELVQSIKIQLDDDISRGIKKVSRNLKGMKTSIDSASASLRKMGKSARNAGANLSLKLTAPIAAAGFFMVKAASDAEETANKFNVVFKEVTEQSKVAAEALAKNYGLSSEESQKLLSNTGDLLTGFGMSGAEALKLSTQVNQLAADLGSFNNLPTEQASRALTSALLGEREAIKSLGIVVNEEMVKNMVEAMEVAGKFTDETLQQKKAIATLKLAMMQSKNAIGDFERSQDSLANQIKILKANAADLSSDFGKVLIPVVLDLIKAIKPFLTQLREMSPEMKRNIVIVAGLVATLGPLLFIFGSMASGIGALIPIVSFLGTAFITVSSAVAGFIAIGGAPLIAVVAGIAAIASIVIDNWEEVKRFFSAFGEFLVAIFKYIDVRIKGFLGFSPLEMVSKAWGGLRDFFVDLWDGILGVFDESIGRIGALIDRATGWIKSITGDVNEATEEAKKLNELGGRTTVASAAKSFRQSLGSGDFMNAESSMPFRSADLALKSQPVNNNQVVVNLRVDKNGNPIVDSAKTISKDPYGLTVNMGQMTP